MRGAAGGEYEKANCNGGDDRKRLIRGGGGGAEGPAAAGEGCGGAGEWVEGGNRGKECEGYCAISPAASVVGVSRGGGIGGGARAGVQGELCRDNVILRRTEDVVLG